MPIAPVANCVVLPDEMRLEDAALIEPLSCAVRGYDVLKSQLGSHVLIYGSGTMGLMMLQLAKQTGAASVDIIDINSERLRTAVALGVSRTAASADELEQPRGWELVIDATGAAAAIQDGLSRVSPGGTFLQFGVSSYATRVTIEPYRIYNKEITITGSMAVLHSFERAADLFASGVLDPDVFISHRLPLSDYVEALGLVPARRWPQDPGLAVRACVEPVRRRTDSGLSLLHASASAAYPVRMKRRMPSIVYSVDAGGSGTVVAVWRAGVVVDTSFYPSIAIASTGTTAACQSLSDLLRGITEHVGKDAWALGCIGSSSMPVAAEAPAPKPLLDVIAVHAPRGRVVLVNDVVPLLWSTPLDGVGIVICSGTGSSVLGRNASWRADQGRRPRTHRLRSGQRVQPRPRRLARRRPFE